MITHSKQGRPYAKLSELKANDIVELDQDFPCHVQGKAVLHDTGNGLFFYCNSGTHEICTQSAGNGDYLIGIHKVDA